MKIAVILPRGMNFSAQGATSVDLVARDMIVNSQFKDQTVVVGAAVDAPFPGFSYHPLQARSQKGRDKEIIAFLKENSFDRVIVHQHPPTAFKIKQALNRQPVILYRHGLLKKRKSWLSRKLRERQFDKLDHIVFVSHFLRDTFLAEYPKLTKKSCVIHNGIDMQFWQPAPLKKKEIIYLGRARADKGIPELLEALKQLDLGEWSVKIIAAVQTETEVAFARHIKAKISQRPSVTLAQNLTSEQVRDKLAQASLVVLPSIVKEGFPRAVVEAMACGCAVIATNSGGVPEAAGDAAYMLDTPTPENIRNAISYFLSAPEKVQLFSQKAREHVVSNLDIKKISKRLDQVYL